MTRPSTERIVLARMWWNELPNAIKGNESIWVILAMYAEYVLRIEGMGGSEPDQEKSGAA